MTIRRMTNTEQVNDRKARMRVGTSGIISSCVEESVGNVVWRFFGEGRGEISCRSKDSCRVVGGEP